MNSLVSCVNPNAEVIRTVAAAGFDSVVIFTSESDAVNMDMLLLSSLVVLVAAATEDIGTVGANK